MIDIHAHILPGADDGSVSVEESLRMLKKAAESGTKVIAATPHFDRTSGYPKLSPAELEAALKSVRREAEREGVDIRIVRGMEIMASEDLPELLSEGVVQTLGGTKYFLVEFAFEEDPDFCFEILRRCRHRGFLPIVAHPERYRFILREPQIAYEWCRMGYGLQINKGSITGRFGEEIRVLAMRLIAHGLAACTASDAHGSERRTTDMSKVKRLLTEEFGRDHAEMLLNDNPKRILLGKELKGLEPYPFR